MAQRLIFSYPSLLPLSKQFFRLLHLTNRCDMIAVGDCLPDGILNENTPDTCINIKELVNCKKAVIFGVPGAFTPGCNKTHLPGYIAHRKKLAEKGVEEVICVAVNDAFVMAAWGEEHCAEGKVRMLADPNATFIKCLGLEISLPPLGGVRSKRFAMVVEDGIVTHLAVEPDGTGLTCSLADQLQL